MKTLIAAVLLAFIIYEIYKEVSNTAAKTAANNKNSNLENNSLNSQLLNSTSNYGSDDYLSIIKQVANAYDINPGILFAITATEQGTDNPNDWNPKAYNPNDPSGAFGLTQVLSDTASELGVSNPYELFNPYTALETTAKYLTQYSPNPNDIVESAQVYNAGPNATFVDTNYIEKAIKNYEYYESNFKWIWA